MENKNIIIIGGAGFIGSSLAKHLVVSNKVVSIDNYFTGTEENHVAGVKYIRSEAKDINKLDIFDVDCVFHFGEYSRVEKSFSEFEYVMNNNSQLHSVLEFCGKNNIKLIYSGSSTKFSTFEEGASMSPYAFSKAKNVDLIKFYAKWYGLDFAICYFYNVYGPGEISEGPYATVVAKFLKLREENKVLPIVRPGTQERNFTHIDDVVSALELIGEMGNGDGYGIGSKQKYSILELSRMLGIEHEFIDERPGNRMGAELVVQKTLDLGWLPKKSLEDYLTSKTS